MKNTQLHIMAGGSVAEGEAACSSGSSSSQSCSQSCWISVGPARPFLVLLGLGGSCWILMVWWMYFSSFKMHPNVCFDHFMPGVLLGLLSQISTCCALCYVPQAVLVKLLWCSCTNLQKVNWTVRVIFHGATLWIYK